MSEEREGRRGYLKTVGALAAGLAVGGAAAWLAKPAERVEIPGVTETVTETAPGATETVTTTAPGPTVTKTITKTITPTPTVMDLTGYKFGLLPRALDYIWWNAFACGAKWWLDARGGSASVMDANYDVKKYNTIMESWARDPEIDGVITSTIGAEECLPGIRALNNAGKIVLLGNNEAGYAPEAILSCWSGNYEPCYDAGVYIREKLTEKYGKPMGFVVVDMSDLRSPNLMERSAGYKDGLNVAENPEIEVHEIQTDEMIDQAATKLGALLRTKTVDAVTSNGMGVNIGYLQAMEREGQLYTMDDPERHIIFPGFDAEPTTVNPACVDGYIDYIIDQPVFAYMAICGYYGVKYLESGKDPDILPKPGDVIKLEDLQPIIKTLVPTELLKPEYKDMEIWVPAEEWAPAPVQEDSLEVYGHPRIKTRMNHLTPENVLNPNLWANVTDYITGWGY